MKRDAEKARKWQQDSPRKSCDAAGCSLPAKSGSAPYCPAHTYRLRVHGDLWLDRPVLNKKLSKEDRFWLKVEKNAAGGCWEWIGFRTADGYGRVLGRGAHRYSYELAHGVIPDGLQVDHLCRNRSCVNPDHLEAVSPRTNVLRSPTAVASVNARKTHCPQGHKYDINNTRLTSDGWRRCKTCEKAARPFRP